MVHFKSIFVCFQIDEVDNEREKLIKQLQKFEATLAAKTTSKVDDDELDAYINKMREEGTKVWSASTSL